MPTTTVHLVRHADPELHGDDPGLSALGRKQAGAVGLGLQSVGVSEVVHGSRRRASQTAQIIADLLGVPCKASAHGNDVTTAPVSSDDQTVAVVTHGFVIGWFVRRALDAPWWRWIGLNQEYASITTIQWSSDVETRLLRFNEQQSQGT